MKYIVQIKGQSMQLCHADDEVKAAVEAVAELESRTNSRFGRYTVFVAGRNETFIDDIVVTENRTLIGAHLVGRAPSADSEGESKQ